MTTNRPSLRSTSRFTSLGFVALLLLGSAVIRLSPYSDNLFAFAEETSQIKEIQTDPPFPRFGSKEDVQAEVMRLALMARDLKVREDNVSQREFEVLQKTALIELSETRIREQLAQLEEAENQLRSTIALADRAAEDDLARLTAVYENMKPKEAAGLFEEMSPDFAAGFLSRMRPDAAALILAGLQASTAYSISVVMAGRNAEVPTSYSEN